MASFVTGNSHRKYRSLRASKATHRYKIVPCFERERDLLLHSLFGIHCGHPRRVHNRRQRRLWRRGGERSEGEVGCGGLKTASEGKKWPLNWLSEWEALLGTLPKSLSTVELLFSSQSVQSFFLFFLLRWRRRLGRGRAEGVELPQKRTKNIFKFYPNSHFL